MSISATSSQALSGGLLLDKLSISSYLFTACSMILNPHPFIVDSQFFLILTLHLPHKPRASPLEVTNVEKNRELVKTLVEFVLP